MAAKRLLVMAAVAGAAALAGCSSNPTHPSSARTTTTTAAAQTTSTASSSTTTTSQPTSTTSSSAATTPATAQNLPVTNDIRSQLVQAGAALNSLPASDYTGLAPGTTYYAYDPVTATYWAAGALAPSPSSEQAQVSAQDDGSYLLFSRPAGAAWTAHNDGLTARPGSSCPVAVPASILALWNWPSGTCQPAG
jgi:outer membrane murein-binding lipoprotein Lpp